jgi:O-antigen/teichoic acid export membrane protein
MNWLKNNPLLAHASLMFAGTMVAHICNLGYQMTVSRILPPKEYALLMAFLGLLTILGRPLLTLQTAINHYVSLMAKEGAGALKAFCIRWLWRTTLPSLLIGGTLIIAAPHIGQYFHLERAAPIVVTGLIIPPMFIAATLSGVAMGLQRFTYLASATMVGGILRVLLGTVFVYLVYPASGWALLGHGLAAYAATGVLAVGVFVTLAGQKTDRTNLPSLRSYLGQSALIQFAYVFLMNADIIIVKHHFPANETFAYAATIGRMATFLPAAIVIAMFPKVAGRKHSTPDQIEFLYTSLRWTLAAVGLAVAISLAVPHLLLHILFGITGPESSLLQQVRSMSVIMGLSALLNVITMYLLAQRQFLAASPIVACAILYALLTRLFHHSIDAIMISLFLCTTAALVFSGATLVLLNRRNGAQPQPEEYIS